MRVHAHKLWILFTMIIFGILLLTVVSVFSLGYVLHAVGFFRYPVHSFWMPLILFFGFSVFLGALLSIFVAQAILKPVSDFTKFTRSVARGDFSVRANTGSAVVEVAELADNLNLMAKKLSQKETLSSDFVRDVSHEFNTPLSTIEGYASLLQDPCISSEKRDEYSTAIIRAAKKLGALSDNILNLSALEDDHGIANETSFRLDEQVRQTILSLERQWAPKDLELDLFLPTTVYFGHEELLAQVWYNLLANAIKFSSDGGKIGVLIEDGLTNVTVRVSDSGVGMNEQTIERVFEKFFQGDSARKVEGNGLGLALVQRIVALSGGSVEVESQLGYGSTFTVSLPRKAV